jgi:pilus assembly protein TadC
MAKEEFYLSEQINKLSSPLKPIATGTSMIFPDLNWNLRKAGMKIDAIIYISIALFFALMVFASMGILFAILFIGSGVNFALGLGISVLFGVMAFFWVMFLPSLKISKSRREIDKNLEYMLKDMQIQLTAGMPLFDIFVTIVNGEYGGCSKVSRKIVEEVQSGKSIITTLDDAGLLSPSEYMRRVLWQIVNALKTGSNVGVSLKMISKEIRDEKENAITSYTQELGLWSLVYMIFAVILPSMGVTLILILSSFLGGATITEIVFWIILVAVMIFQVIFISIIKSKRPDI